MKKKVSAFKTELDPNLEMIRQLKLYCGTKRFIWNYALGQHESIKEGHIEYREFMFGEIRQQMKLPYYNWMQTRKDLLVSKKHPKHEDDNFLWLQSISKCVPEEALRDLNQAFSNFFENPKHFCYPKFKKKGKCKDSFTLTGSIDLIARGVQLPCLGWVRLKEKNVKQKLDLINNDITSVTISRKADRWFISFKLRESDQAFEQRKLEEELVQPSSKQMTIDEWLGVDLGLKAHITTSSGLQIEAPKFYRKSEQSIKRKQRNLSRKQKGSKNYEKAKLELAKAHLKVSNRRENHAHQVSNMLAKTKLNICMETLKVKNMMKNHKLAKSLMDASLSQITIFTEYKVKREGNQFFKADPFYASTKTCCDCEFKLEEIDLGTREWDCPKCHVHHDRDINAARNLQKEGYRRLYGNPLTSKVSEKPEGESLKSEDGEDLKKQEASKSDTSQ